MDSKLEGLEQRMDSKLEGLESRMNEKLFEQETKLLTAFHGWSPRIETRIDSHSAVLRAIDVEVEQLRKRVQKLEEEK